MFLTKMLHLTLGMYINYIVHLGNRTVFLMTSSGSLTERTIFFNTTILPGIQYGDIIWLLITISKELKLLGTGDTHSWHSVDYITNEV